MSKIKSIVKQLEEHYGGKWIYHNFKGLWTCDNPRLTAMYMSEGGYDTDGNYIPTLSIFSRLTIYGTKPYPEKFYPKIN